MIKNLTIAALLLVSATSFGQARDTEKEKAVVKGMSAGKVVKEGTILIDAYYGFPFWWGTLLKAAKESAGGTMFTDTKVTNTNHIGGRFEYMINEKIGIGAEYTYAKAAINYTETTTNSAGVTTTNTYNDAIIKQRALLRMAIHFGESDKFDPYMCFGAGYKGSKFSSTYNGAGTSVTFNFIPVAIRIGGGFRYFFTENIGLNAEVGIGGPLVQGGLSVKF
ncbi:MAG: outer membrane beta-barrel protein [Bacteroidia bacterium]|nr:outer membrane beta-barrel protein [Bacteroidia bacterium]